MTTDEIMALADEYRRTNNLHIDTRRAALRAAIEQLVQENLQRGNVIGRISAHLLGNKNNVTDEDVVIAAAEIGRGLQGAMERARRAEAEVEQLKDELRIARERMKYHGISTEAIDHVLQEKQP